MNYEPLLNPHREPPAFIMTAIDHATWLFPLIACVLAIAGGVIGLKPSPEHTGAWLSIAGGLVGIVGVSALVYATNIRDKRLAEARSMGELGVDMAEHVQRSLPTHWG